MKKTFLYVAIAVVIILIAFILIHRSSDFSNSDFSYSVLNYSKRLNLFNRTGFLYMYRDGHLIGFLNIRYSCCAKLKVKYSRDANNISLYVDNVGEMCNCICHYPIKFDILIPDGSYNFTVYGIKYDKHNVHFDYDRIISEIIDTENVRECYSDEDCVHAQSCCHKKSQMCVPFYMFEEKNCSGVFCTENCEECTSCSCVNGKCVTKNVGGCC